MSTQKKKNIRLSISLVVLVVACFTVYLLSGSGGGAVDVSMFRVDDYNTMDHVVMTGPRGRVELSTSGGRWRVNDQFTADRNLIDVLFATLQQAEPRRPVATRQRDSIAHHLEVQGTRVELLEGTRLIKAFLAGGNSAKTEAYFMETESGTPYIMTIPGYRVYVSGIFELAPPGWRDKYIFGLNWLNFAELQASFPGEPESGFSVKRENNTASIVGMPAADTTRLNDFMDAVSFMTAQEFTDGVPDSLRKGQPIMRIVVKDIANREYSLDLYQRKEREGPYQGIVDGTLHALLDLSQVENVLRRKSHFARQPGSE